MDSSMEQILSARDDSGDIITEIRASDGYVNATKMCQAAGKRWAKFMENACTRIFLDELASTVRIRTTDLVQQSTGGNGERHTWIHHQVAIHLAQWCSPKFAVAVTTLVSRYLQGEITTEESQAAAGLLATMKSELEATKNELEATRNRLETLESSKDPECDGYMYSFSVDLTNPNAHRKIGVTEILKLRRRQHGTTNPRGGYDITRSIPIGFTTRKAESILEAFLKFNGHHINGENYNVSQDDIRAWITLVSGMAHVARKSPEIRSQALKMAASVFDRLVFDAPSPSPTNGALMYDVGTQIDDDLPPISSDPTSETPQIVEDPYKFDQFIEEMCITAPEASVPATSIVGAYRLWSRSASKKAYHAMLDYLATRFRPKRLPCFYSTEQVVNGYSGVTLKPRPPFQLEMGATPAEIFVHEECELVPHGKSLASQVKSEFQRWWKKVKSDEVISKTDYQQLWNILDHEAIKCNIWTNNTNGTGYYGLHLRCNDNEHQRQSSSTSKPIEKVNVVTGNVVNKWGTIAKAAEAENICPAKLSRMIRAGITTQDACMYRPILNFTPN